MRLLPAIGPVAVGPPQPHLQTLLGDAFRGSRARRRAVKWLADHCLIDDETASRYHAAHPDTGLP